MLEKIGHLKVETFKIKNRSGFAAVCCQHLTEGSTPEEAYQRMVKALRRSNRKEES
jgi:GTP cyclohydrolase III